VLLEKLIVAELAIKLASLYRTLNFIAVFTTACYGMLP
jgi:hypothetical protein